MLVILGGTQILEALQDGQGFDLQQVVGRRSDKDVNDNVYTCGGGESRVRGFIFDAYFDTTYLMAIFSHFCRFLPPLYFSYSPTRLSHIQPIYHTLDETFHFGTTFQPMQKFDITSTYLYLQKVPYETR